MNLQHWPRPHSPRIRRLQRRRRETSDKNFLDRLHILWRSQPALAPLGENRRNLVGVFFRDEVVETGLRFAEQRIQRPRLTVVRMQVELATNGGSLARIGRMSNGKAEAAQAWGKQSRPGCLATASEKIAPATIDRMHPRRMHDRRIKDQSRVGRSGAAPPRASP